MSTAPRLLPLVVLLPRLLAAQGVTSAAIQGRVTRADGSAIVGATVHVVNLSNGRRWEIATRSTGRYLLEDVAVGGPYRIEVRALGFAPETTGAITLTLGQRLAADFALRPAAVVLAPVEVTATTDPVFNSGRTGPTEIISRARIAALPNPGRDFLTLTVLSAHAMVSPSSGTAGTGGVTIGGQNRLYNSFQIDGGINHDLYRGRLPGRETLPRPISLEALEEIQVLAAPFDVRHGAFAGGLVNAVTKSGTNAVHGSVFGFLADAALVGRGATGEAVGDFTTWQYGGTVGGPIMRDRAHYFLSVDVQRAVVPDPGPLVVDTAGGADLARTGVSYASAVRFQDILRNVYGLDPGTLGPVDGHVRAEDVFGKVTIQLGTNSHLEASHHYAGGDRWGFIDRVRGTYFLSAVGQRNPSTVNASRVIWTSLLGHRWSNELIASRLRLHDTCRSSATYPLIRAGPIARGQLVAGAAGACPPHPINSVVQDALEVTENLTGAFGAHVLTLGVHGEALRFRDEFLQNSSGIWNFVNLDSLEAGRPSRYERTLPGPARAGGLNFRARQLGLYAQDRWTPKRRMTLTLGVRVDVPVLPDPVGTNDSLRASLGIDTGRLPSERALWSPRFSISYALGGQRRTFLTGGIGLFSGRPPYTWLGSAYRDNGMRELFLACTGRQQVPRFEPANWPAVCADGTGPVPRLSFFDSNVKFPQNLRLALGLERELSERVIGTFDVLYTRATQQLYVTDVNLVGPVAVARGEGNRPLYGTITGTTTSITSIRPARRDAAFGQVVRVSNRNGDEALSLSVQMRTQLRGRVEASAFYSYTRARDRMSLVNPFARQNLENTALDGTLEARRLRTSYFEIPHRALLSATVRLPLRASLSLLYAGASGTPYTYVIEGDANADGIPPLFANDIAYVPRDSLDIALASQTAWDSLDSYIEAEPCLRRQRGRILARNSCRNPWFGTLSARLTKSFPTVAGRSVELTADVYNVLNLLNRQWGQSRRTVPDPWVRLLSLVGYDAGAERGVYRPALPDLRRTVDLPSRWRVELGVRHTF
jgi:hypothetical protein